jgi:hypothetical protein
MIFEFDFGEAIEDFAGSCTHVPMRTPEFGEYVGDEEGFHHSENGGAFFQDDVTYGANHTERRFLMFRMLLVIRSHKVRNNPETRERGGRRTE